MDEHIILEKVCEGLNLNKEAVLSKSREANLVNARILYSILSREFTKNNLITISAGIGRHHSSVVHYTKIFDNYMQTDKHFRQYYKLCKTLVINHLIHSNAKNFQTDMLQQIDSQINKLLEIRKSFDKIKQEAQNN